MYKPTLVCVDVRQTTELIITRCPNIDNSQLLKASKTAL